jgi:hypothetical protein
MDPSLAARLVAPSREDVRKWCSNRSSIRLASYSEHASEVNTMCGVPAATASIKIESSSAVHLELVAMYHSCHFRWPKDDTPACAGDYQLNANSTDRIAQSTASPPSRLVRLEVVANKPSDTLRNLGANGKVVCRRGWWERGNCADSLLLPQEKGVGSRSLSGRVLSVYPLACQSLHLGTSSFLRYRDNVSHPTVTGGRGCGC